jgi:UPF0176 protein
MEHLVAITTFYRFQPLPQDRVHELKTNLEEMAKEHGVRGLCLLGKEGLNATLSGPAEGILALKELVRRELAGDLVFKDSFAAKHPFLVFKVKIKGEIVSLGKPALVPEKPVNHHLTPAEWHAALLDPETVILDTRNDYEVDLGKFRGAVDFRLQEFNEFPERVKHSGIGKDKRVLMYCTGGIRCEKAILEMHEQGYSNVAQLEGGILNYLKEFPNQNYEGDCFVFDYRVAVDQDLKPAGKYSLCPHCGQPATAPLTCSQCGREEAVCSRCKSRAITTCSKNCAHHALIGSKSSKTHLPELRKRLRKLP